MSSRESRTLTLDKAEALIKLLTEGLTQIKDNTGEFLLVLKDGTVIDTKGWQGWEWTHGIATTALYRHSIFQPGSPSCQFSHHTAIDWFELQYRLTEGKGAPKNINTMSPFYCLSSMLSDGSVKDEKWMAWCTEWAEWIMNDLPRTSERGFQHITYANAHEGNLWDDTLMMTVIPLLKIGVLLDRSSYIEEAKYQMLVHVKYLVDTTTGLWFHAWEFTPGSPLSLGHNFARALWARGNCWITVAIPLFIEILGDKLPRTNPLHQYLTAVLQKQIDALVKCQDTETGLWHTLLIDPSSYLESSATAGFAAGIYMATRLGLVNDPAYIQCADKALNAVLDNLSSDGELDKVSFGTGASMDLDCYKKIRITPMPYGQALAMLALVEWEELHAGKI